LTARSRSPPGWSGGGAAVDVPLEITGNASEPVQVFVTVTQRVNRRIAAGSGFANFGCRPNICGTETDSETVRVRR
jgi:hypothetical protein